MTQVVRTRFAPSPTGYLHVGGARTALFNYLLARRLGGKFILRIEDTDQTRNIERADAKLMDDLRWLGLQWDEGPGVGGPCEHYHQSKRLDRYRAVGRELIAAGNAYYAFETPAELDALREAARREKRNFRYPRPAGFPSEAQAQSARDAGRPVVVRMKVPEQECIIADQILGDVRVAPGELDDFVILKADGWPTYHFAVVVDDQDMLVTHVLRGQEHLLNSARHMALQNALGYRRPVYAHLPIIQNMDGSKMSKREKPAAVRAALDAVRKLAAAAGPGREAAAAKLEEVRTIAGGDAVLAALAEGVSPEQDVLRRMAAALRVELPEIEIHDFRVSGYLPEALLNFIALLGWSPGNDLERMSVAEMCALFGLERIGKTNARFDRAKLLNFNTTAAAAATPERRLAGLKDYLAVNDTSPLHGLDDAALSKLLDLCAGFRVFRDIEVKCGAIFVADDALEFDMDAVQKNLLKADAAGLKTLAELRDILATQTDWSAAALEQTLRQFGEQRGLGLGKVAQPLRIAVTGGTISPPIFDTLALLGRERAMGRVARAAEQFRAASRE
ncbi:Glutamate--tRNA ligase 1 [Phycisphaerae bacterium RAS1]|nr:Glutamate--tRNA ligase 1 [Phycisphaerae bacterium RAS1]